MSGQPPVDPPKGAGSSSRDDRPPPVDASPVAAPRVDSRLLDEIFGQVLPDTTADERDPAGNSGYDEQWYRENRPPHHGG